jgi:hypothetical protein
MTERLPLPSPSRAAWLLVALFVLSLPAVTPRIYASDEVEYFAYLRSLWFDGDLSFDNEYRHFYRHGVTDAGFHETFLELTTATGLRVNFAPIGCAILWAPFYLVADLATRAAHAAGADAAVDGYSWPYLYAVAYGSAIYGLLALLLSRSIADRLVGRGLAATVVVWLGTPLLFYMYVAPPMSHAASAFVVAAFVATWLRVRERWRLGGVMALGALAGLMAMVREQDAFFVVGPAVDLTWTAIERIRRERAAAWAPWLARLALRVGAGAVVAALVFVPQALAYLTLYGHVGPSPLVARKMMWSAPYAAGVVASPAHGFLVWTPLAAVALFGCVLLATRSAAHRRIAVCLLAMVALQIYVAGSVGSWTVAGAFGQRRFVALTAILVTGVAAVLTHVRHGTGLVWAALGLCVWWNLGLMLQFGAGLMDRQRLEPARNAWTNFVVLPVEAPRLAWRYVVARETFYRNKNE